MKKLLGLLACSQLLACAASAQTANLIMKDDGSGSAVPTSNIFENSGSMGFGTNAPSARLQINKPPTTFTNDLFLINNTILGPPPGFTVTETPLFKVTADGFTGIGIAVPEVLLHIKSVGFGDPENPLSAPVFILEDENDERTMLIANSGDATNPAAFMVIRSRANMGIGGTDVVPAFAVMNAEEELLNFAVGGDGSVVLGMDVSGSSAFENDAQLNVHAQYHGNHNYLFNVANTAGDVKFFSVRKTGEVGIGRQGITNTALTVYREDANTYLDLVANGGYTKAIRFMNGTTQARHVITEVSGDFVVDPGVSGGGGNDLLKVDGSEYVTGSIGIGTSSPGARLGILNTSMVSYSYASVVKVDNVLGKAFAVQYDGGSGYTDKFTVYGNGDVYMKGTLTVESSSGSEFKIYTDGKVRAREVQVDLQTIPDYVFKKDYKLYSIEELNHYVVTYGHLPNMLGESDYNEMGCINLTELNLKLLEKVEELSLYIIQLNERIKVLEK